jgi:hypothetical protein
VRAGEADVLLDGGVKVAGRRASAGLAVDVGVVGAAAVRVPVSWKVGVGELGVPIADGLWVEGGGVQVRRGVSVGEIDVPAGGLGRGGGSAGVPV